MAEATRRWSDIPYADCSPAQRLDIYLPGEGEGPFPVIFRIHGGGFEMGDKDDMNLPPWLRGLRHGYAVVSVNYRLSGEARFPAAVQDVKAGVRWLRANGHQYQLDVGRIVAVGDSAGGNLAAMLATSEGAPLFEDAALGNPAHSSRVQAAVDWFGPIDFLTMDAQRDENGLPPDPPPGPGPGFGPAPGTSPTPGLSPEMKYLGAPLAEVPDLVRAANPATYVHPGMPPILIQHGGADPLVPRQQSVDFARVIQARAGAGRGELDILDGAGHGTPEFETAENMERVFRFVDRYLK